MPTDSHLTLRHLFGFLIGHRASVLAAAKDRSTIWVGLMFVAMAALAREYDGVDLLREPWHLLIPFGASAVVSFVLFLLVRVRPLPNAHFGREYLRFLGLFWLTAPMALLYAIPYEHFLSAPNAVRANLWTLAFVSLWRGLVISRVVEVVTGRSFVASFILCAFVADLFAAPILFMMPSPILQVMGGIRLSEVDQVLLSVGLLSKLISIVAFPILLIAAGIVLSKSKPKSPLALDEKSESSTSSRTARGPLALAIACVLGFLALLPITQPAQQLRSKTEELLRSGRLKEAVLEMSSHERSDYPPLWDPPPRLGWSEAEVPDTLEMLAVVVEHPATGWVRAEYIDKFERRFLYQEFPFPTDIERWPKVESMLDRLPEGSVLRERHSNQIRRFQDHYESMFGDDP